MATAGRRWLPASARVTCSSPVRAAPAALKRRSRTSEAGECAPLELCQAATNPRPAAVATAGAVCRPVIVRLSRSSALPGTWACRAGAARKPRVRNRARVARSICIPGSYEDPRRFVSGLDLVGHVESPLRVEIAPLADVQEGAVAAAALGLVEGLVGEAEELGGRLDVEVGEGGRAGAQGERHPLPLPFEGQRFDPPPHPLGHGERRLAGRLLEQQPELLAAVAAAERPLDRLQEAGGGD